MVKKKLFIAIFIMFIIMTFLGCASTGMYVTMNQTHVELSKPNFKIKAVNVGGEAEISYIIGVSYSIGAITECLGLIGMGDIGSLYTTAINNLWKNYEKKYGPIINQKLALTNVRYDTDILNLGVYTRLKLKVCADVIEFSE